LDLGLGGLDDGLDLRRVDQTSDIRVVDLGSGKVVILLLDGRLVEGSEDFIEKSEGTLGPDDEAAEMSTRSELEKVEATDVANFDTGQVAEGLNDAVVLSVDDEGSTTLTVATVPHLSFTGTKFAGVGNFGDIGVSVDTPEESNCFLGLLERLSSVANDERDFLNFFDAVTTGENERRESRSSESGDDGESALVLVDLDVPFPPGLGRGEHTTTTAHVTESGLSRAVGSSTTDTGDTSDGTTSSPRLSAGLVAGLGRDGVRLATIFGDGLMDLLDYIKTDGSGEDVGKRESLGGLARVAPDVNGGSVGHVGS